MKLLYTLIILSAFFISCSTEPEDCAGVAGGTAEEDMCGVCDTDATNDCVQDCAGVWGGFSYLDDCGFCDVNLVNDNTTCEQDCAGVWGGTALLDYCGVCDSDSSNDNTTCFFGQWLFYSIEDTLSGDGAQLIPQSQIWNFKIDLTIEISSEQFETGYLNFVIIDSNTIALAFPGNNILTDWSVDGDVLTLIGIYGDDSIATFHRFP